MNWSRWVSCLLSAACGFIGCKPAPSVQVLGESTRLAEGKPSPRQSALFDGQVVSLRGARGETLGVSVRISDGKTRSVRLELPSEVAEVRAFAVRSLEVREPSSELYGASTGRGRYPDVLVPVTGDVPAAQLAYFDVALPPRARPGRYRGRLSVGERSIPVVLELSTATIDLMPNPLVWVFYLPRELARAHGLGDDDSAALLAKEEQYYSLFRAHGALLAADLPPGRFEVRRRFVHDVKYWPVAVDTSSDAAIERDVHSWLELFPEGGVIPFVIPVDEPKTAAQKQRARHIADVIGRAGGGRPRLLRGVTDARNDGYGDALDLYFSPVNIPKVAADRRPLGERYWTYNGRPPSAGSMILDTDGVALRTWGWIAERYDIELWYAWEGLYFSDRYNGGGATDVMLDPLTFDERSRGGSDWGNGDGLLAYPGPLASLRLKALRRGLQDRLLLRQLSACGAGNEARRIVRRVVPRALGEAGASDAPSWSVEEPVWESARREVLDAIERQCDGPRALAD
jgi:hypothetical protein